MDKSGKKIKREDTIMIRDGVSERVIEWSFDCNEASENAIEVFNRVMNRDWLREHGIHPFDTDAAWRKVAEELSKLGERCFLSVIKVTYPDSRWDSFYTNLLTGR